MECLDLLQCGTYELEQAITQGGTKYEDTEGGLLLKIEPEKKTVDKTTVFLSIHLVNSCLRLYVHYFLC